MAEFTPITFNTQEEYDAAFKDRVAREKKKYEDYTSPEALKGIKADYDKQISDLKDSIAASSKKYEGYEKEKAAYEAKIKAYESDSVKTRIAHEYGLSYDAKQFLTGDDEESIAASAKALKALVGNKHAQHAGEDEPVMSNSSKAKAEQSLRSLAKSLGGNN